MMLRFGSGPNHPWPALILAAVLVVQGCSIKVLKREWVRPADLSSLDGKTPFLRAHLPDGGVIVFQEWTLDEGRGRVTGRGILYDAGREVRAAGFQSVAVDSVSIFESNVVQTSPAVAPLTVLTVASAALSVFCLTHPKSCFGSCPTFYAPGLQGPILQAEGFSASVAPVLESPDIDALHRCLLAGDRLEIEMRNEALETHVVRRADLLLAARPAAGRTFQTPDGRFLQATGLVGPISCRGPEGDALAALLEFDGIERCSPADSTDLARREQLSLSFTAAQPGPKGLAIASRQSLLSTFLFYQGLAYLGGQAAPALARAVQILEPDPEARTLGGVLGRIEVEVQDGLGRWIPAGAVGETGPLATNVHLVELGELPAGPVQVRLTMTKGHWRLDQVQLADLGQEVQPVRVLPSVVLADGLPDAEALAALMDPARTLVTFPGDSYTLVYPLPEDPQGFEPFLDSKGYYLEWMRQEWFAEEDPARAALLMAAPETALRVLAPAFKELEPDMEAQFWGSRYAR